MKIVKAIIGGVRRIPKYNQPYFTETLRIDSVTVFYETKGHDIFLDTMFGIKASPEFFNILDNDVEIELDIKEREHFEEFYKDCDFKSACFNRNEDNNPYQLPDWKTIK